MVPLLLFSVLSALVDVYAGDRLQGVDPGSVAAVAFTVTGAVFCVAAVIRLRWTRLLAVVRAHGGDLAVLNLTTALTWLTLLYALKLMEPAVANVVSIAIGPAFTVLMQALWWRRDRVLPAELVSALGILVTLVVLVGMSLAGESGVGARSLSDMALGVSAAVVSGGAAAANVVFSARLGAAGLDVPSVMGLRFGAVAVGGWVLVACTGGTGGRLPDADALGPGLVVAVIGVSIPAYLVQMGVRRVTPMTASMLISLAPAMTLLLQLVDPRLTFSISSTVGITVITAFIALSLLARRGRQPSVAQTQAQSQAQAQAQQKGSVHALRDS